MCGWFKNWQKVFFDVAKKTLRNRSMENSTTQRMRALPSRKLMTDRWSQASSDEFGKTERPKRHFQRACVRSRPSDVSVHRSESDGLCNLQKRFSCSLTLKNSSSPFVLGLSRSSFRVALKHFFWNWNKEEKTTRCFALPSSHPDFYFSLHKFIAWLGFRFLIRIPWMETRGRKTLSNPIPMLTFSLRPSHISMHYV